MKKLLLLASFILPCVAFGASVTVTPTTGPLPLSNFIVHTDINGDDDGFRVYIMQGNYPDKDTADTAGHLCSARFGYPESPDGSAVSDLYSYGTGDLSPNNSGCINPATYTGTYTIQIDNNGDGQNDIFSFTVTGGGGGSPTPSTGASQATPLVGVAIGSGLIMILARRFLLAV